MSSPTWKIDFPTIELLLQHHAPTKVSQGASPLQGWFQKLRLDLEDPGYLTKSVSSRLVRVLCIAVAVALVAYLLDDADDAGSCGGS